MKAKGLRECNNLGKWNLNLRIFAAMSKQALNFWALAYCSLAF
jgi:hypothetical protein